jgi:hypothetical protein
MKIGKYILFVVLILVIVGIFNRNTGNTNKTNAQEIQHGYSQAWQSPSTKQVSEIGRILAKNNISGCGEFYVKTKSGSDSELAVACTADGKSFSYYLVWLHSEGVTGIKDDGITKP